MMEPDEPVLMHIPDGLVGQVLKLFRPADPREALQRRLLELQVARAVTGAATFVLQADAATALRPKERQDHILVGRRGTGKTAAAVWLAQQSGLPWFFLDAAPGIAAMLGGQSIRWSRARDLRDAFLVIDESCLRSIPRGELFEFLALARQRGVFTATTSQTTAAVDLHIWRLGPTLTYRRPDDLAAKFEREELLILAAQAVQAFAGVPENDLRTACVYRNGSWTLTQLELPTGWTADTSRLWR